MNLLDATSGTFYDGNHIISLRAASSSDAKELKFPPPKIKFQSKKGQKPERKKYVSRWIVGTTSSFPEGRLCTAIHRCIMKHHQQWLLCGRSGESRSTKVQRLFGLSPCWADFNKSSGGGKVSGADDPVLPTQSFISTRSDLIGSAQVQLPKPSLGEIETIIITCEWATRRRKYCFKDKLNW